uniref:CSON007905 protein n=1 Tax=Culicoides sonorensis TaxID=179676 RepID=A0A336N6Z6_CULSO
MEIDVKQSTQKSKRRKRAQRMQAERGKEVVGGGEVDSGEEDYGSLKREKTVRPPNRRKRSKDTSPILEEDIIDGFAILAFKSYEDLEFAMKIASKRNEKRLSSIIELTKLMADEKINDVLLSPQKNKTNLEPSCNVRKTEVEQKRQVTTFINQNSYCQDAGTSDDSGRASERLTNSSTAQRDAESSRDRLSDASSRCSSGKGYICDSEGDDDKVSDTGSGFSNSHAYATKSSKHNGTSPLIENTSNNSNNSENVVTKTDQQMDQKDLPPPALPNILIQNIQEQKSHLSMTQSEEKNNDDKYDQKNSIARSIIKSEEGSQDNKPNNQNDCTHETGLTKESLNAQQDFRKEDRMSIHLITSNERPASEISSTSLYRTPYSQSTTSFPNYKFTIPPEESKENQSSSSVSNSEVSSPILSSVKDIAPKTKSDKIAPPNIPKERDNFSDIDSLSVSSVVTINSTEIPSRQPLSPSKNTTAITFPRPLPTATWPINTPQTDIASKTLIGANIPKTTIPPPIVNPPTTIATTFATPMPPTTSASLSFSAESLFSNKPKEQTDLLRRELDNRFLDRAGLTNVQNNQPYMRQELHHHQHQHTHLHQHHQQIIPTVTPGQSTMFSTPIFKDIPKIGGVDSPFYRTGIGMPIFWISGFF